VTDAPRRLLAFLIGTWCENYSRERAARAIGASLRTTDRALSALVKLGMVARQRGGRATSAKLQVLMDLCDFPVVARYMAHGGALSVKGGALCAPHLNCIKNKNTKERKPVSFERITERERRAIARATPIGGRREPVPLPWEEQLEEEAILRGGRMAATA
jgi:hypothetical protein